MKFIEEKCIKRHRKDFLLHLKKLFFEKNTYLFNNVNHEEKKERHLASDWIIIYVLVKPYSKVRTIMKCQFCTHFENEIFIY